MKNIAVLVMISISMVFVRTDPSLARFEGMVPQLGSMIPQMGAMAPPQAEAQADPVEKIETLEKQLEEDLKNPIELDAEVDKKLDALIASAENDPKALDFIFQMAVSNSLLSMINDQDLETKLKGHKVEEEFQPVVKGGEAEEKKEKLVQQMNQSNKVNEGLSNIEELFTQVNERIPQMKMPSIQEVDDFQPIEQYKPLHSTQNNNNNDDDELARVPADIILIGNNSR